MHEREINELNTYSHVNIYMYLPYFMSRAYNHIRVPGGEGHHHSKRHHFTIRTTSKHEMV